MSIKTIRSVCDPFEDGSESQAEMDPLLSEAKWLRLAARLLREDRTDKLAVANTCEQSADAIEARVYALDSARQELQAVREALERALKWRSCAGAYCNGDHKTLAEMRADFDAGDAALKPSRGA